MTLLDKKQQKHMIYSEKIKNVDMIELKNYHENHLNKNSKKVIKEYKIAGILKQLKILLWKNYILSKRNKIGIVCEIIPPLFFILLLTIIRFSVPIEYKNSQNNELELENVLELFNKPSFKADTIIYYPDNKLIKDIVFNGINLIKNYNYDFDPIFIGTNISNGTLLDKNLTSNLIAMFSFPASYETNLPENVEYNIFTNEELRKSYRVDSSFVDKNEYMYKYSPEHLCFDRIYFQLYDDFNALKHAIDLSIISYQTNVVLDDFLDTVQIMQFPCTEYVHDELRSTFAFFIPIIINISFLFTFIKNINNVIEEKKSKMKEYLKLVGIKWYALCFTWFIRIFIMYFFIGILITIIGAISFKTDDRDDFNNTISKGIFYSTDSSVIFLTFFVYSFQSAAFIVLFSQFFKTPFNAKIVGIIFWIVSGINVYDFFSKSIYKYLFCFIPNSGLIFSLQTIFQYERSGQRLKFMNIYRNIFDNFDNKYINLGTTLACMSVFSLFYFVIAWYVEHVFPGEYGVPLPFYFPFMLSYWKKNRKSLNDQDSNKNSLLFDVEEQENATPSIQIKNITKEYKTGLKKQKVLNNLSLNIYNNQITGLLGHNGAGKTTLTYMLTGLIPPTSGTATILGYDIVNELDKIKTSIGFCSQYNILYDDLNVEEHLKLITLIKGYSDNELDNEILRISKFVGLNNDLKTESKFLSGGMKRRLSVAMALVGDSKIIILDEPTSGLDPFNRHVLWELIRKYKKDRTIILTTHFMDEADALSDRIAIINHGEVKCCGSPIFLKNLYGNGYQLTITKAENFNEKEFLNTVISNISNYKIETNIAGEITISISNEVLSKLPNLLKKIENSKESLGINSYGISSSTIEDVFLKIGGIDKNGDLINDNEKFNDLVDTTTEKFLSFKNDIKQISGFKLWLKQLQALMIKRYLLIKNRYALFFTTLFLPILLETIICFILPTTLNTIDFVEKTKSYEGIYDLNIENYKPYTMPISIYNDQNIDSLYLSNTLKLFYEDNKKTGIQIKEVENVPSYVFQERKENIKNIISNYYTGMSINITSSNKLLINVYYSTLAYHSSASMLNEISNILLKYYSNNSQIKTIKTYNHPIIGVYEADTNYNFLQYLACIDILPLSMINFINGVIFALTISLFVIHVGKERINGSKNLQLLSGLHFITYWISNFIFDFIICLCYIIGFVGAIKLVDYLRDDPNSETYVFATSKNLPYLFLLLFFSSFAWLPVAFIFTNFFKTEIISFVILLIVLGLGAYLDMVFSFFQLFLRMKLTNSTLKDILYVTLDVFRWLFVILFPNVTIKRGLFNLKTRNNRFCIDTLNTLLEKNYIYDAPPLQFNEPGIGLMIFTSLSQFLIGTIILLFIEKKLNIKIKNKFKKKSKYKLDDTFDPNLLETEVFSEYNRIKNEDINKLLEQQPLILNDVKKIYKKKNKNFVAVNHLSFGINRKECFGLLGLNGAGKTTAFKILIGEINATSGNAFINGYNIDEDSFNARRNLGFCPQYDYLPDYLTVKQTLKLFARLRGIESKIISKIVNDMINVFKLNEFSNKFVQNLSGGNKRKVSTAISFLGNPSVIILDEPTTGMDPASKRYFWKVINKARESEITILLTTHSMEECEALCTKLAIMVNGQFQCIGSIQNLKRKYGKGYTLIIKYKKNQDDGITDTINDFLKINISSIFLKDKQDNTLFFEIEYNQNQSNNLSNIFSLIENNKDILHIETYSISQTKLEDVFLSFASSHYDS